MNEEQIALARRAVACKGWRWMHGMSNHIGQVIGYVGDGGVLYCGDSYADMPALPDLTDPATLGCLLALVREAHQSKAVHNLYVPYLERWECADRSELHGRGVTEAEALVEALEGAP